MGLCGSLTLLKVWWLRHPAGVPAAALSGRPGLAWWPLLTRPASAPLLSLLPSNLSQCTAHGLDGVKTKPFGWRAKTHAPVLTPAHLQWRHCERKQRKNRRGSAAEAAERLRRACQAQGNLDNPPGRSFAVTNAGRKSQGRNSLSLKKQKPLGRCNSPTAKVHQPSRTWRLIL
jgi:hypothetical protein